MRSKYVGENLFAKYSPDYKWYYLSDQTPDEVTLLKIFDTGEGVTKRMFKHSFENDRETETVCVTETPHAAFKPNYAGTDAPYRQSIEVRALVFGK